MVAAQQRQLPFGNRRALRGNCRPQAYAPTAEGIQLSLDEHEGMSVRGVTPRAVEIEEQIALRENRCFR